MGRCGKALLLALFCVRFCSCDGSKSADYSTGNKLTVCDLKTQQVVRAWAWQVRSQDDLILSELAFAPDGKSLFARLDVPGEDPLMQFDIASGKISPSVLRKVQSLVTVGNGLKVDSSLL